MHNFLQVIKLMSRRRIVVFVFLSIIFSYITVLLFTGYFRYHFQSSVTLSALDLQLLEILGYNKYGMLMNFFNIIHQLMFIFFFLLFSYFFYRHEQNRQRIKSLENIIKETVRIAEGDFDYELTTTDQYMEELVKNINNIVSRLKVAIEEERHIEHTKNELITNVSHDLRTPLTSIVGYLRLIEQDQYQDEVALRYYTGIVFEKALNLEKLINELFEYTRMQDHQLKLKMYPINVAEMLGQIIIQSDIHFKENNVICRENISEGKLLINGDGDRLARVFENLILNAIHYGKEGKYVDIFVKEMNDQVVVTVTNYGNTISSIDLPHIFERFYRVEKSRASHTGGAGLGLAIAKSIIIHHGGTIDVESNIEKTSFIVKLTKI